MFIITILSRKYFFLIKTNKIYYKNWNVKSHMLGLFTSWCFNLSLSGLVDLLVDFGCTWCAFELFQWGASCKPPNQQKSWEFGDFRSVVHGLVLIPCLANRATCLNLCYNLHGIGSNQRRRGSFPPKIKLLNYETIMSIHA